MERGSFAALRMTSKGEGCHRRSFGDLERRLRMTDKGGRRRRKRKRKAGPDSPFRAATLGVARAQG